MPRKPLDAAGKWLHAQAQSRHDKLNRMIAEVLSDEETKAKLALTEEDIQILTDISRGKSRYRYVGNQLLALRMRIAATLEPPKQSVGVDGKIEVTVKTIGDPTKEGEDD